MKAVLLFNLYHRNINFCKSGNGILPPGAHISMKRAKIDPISMPEYGERVPYVVIYGKPSDRLVDQVVSPHALLNDR